MKYKCPNCSNAIELSNGNLVCNNCMKDWIGNSKYPDFFQNDFYWGEIPQKLMREVCDFARSNNWKEALEEKVKPNYPKVYEYIINQNRADWRILLDISDNSKILDLGAGWGTISSILSNYAGEVYALEGTKERIDFVDIRIKQDRQLNIKPLRADFKNPPFFDESFDLIVCNGVLEWASIIDFSVNPRQGQINFLKKIYSLLNAKGTLYIGIENRFAFSSFYGAIDHSGFPYTNLMPRILADITMRLNSLIKGKTKLFFLSRTSGYRTYTYSFRGYQKLLKEAGFKYIKLYFSIPSYNNPNAIIPIDDVKMYKFYLKHLRNLPSKRLKKILFQAYNSLIYLGIHKWVENTFSIVVKK